MLISEDRTAAIPVPPAARRGETERRSDSRKQVKICPSRSDGGEVPRGLLRSLAFVPLQVYSHLFLRVHIVCSCISGYCVSGASISWGSILPKALGWINEEDTVPTWRIQGRKPRPRRACLVRVLWKQACGAGSESREGAPEPDHLK